MRTWLRENSRITFNEEMIRQLRKGAQFGGPKRKTIGDWAATFKHELVHTRQLKVAWTASLASQAAGEGHPLEAEAWGEGFKAYWKWLRRATAKYAKARTYEEKQKYAKEVIDLAESFKSYDSNYRHPDAKLGPLPEGLRFEPLDGREDSDPLRFAEALREAGKISKELSPTLHLAVRLSKSVLKVKPGEPMTLHARPENVWSPSSKKSNSVTFTWKAGSKRLAETSGTLVRTATVDETITVIAQDDRSQKAEASCQVIVEKPEVAANPVPQAPEPKTAPKAPAPAPAAKTPSPAQKGSKVEYAWVHTDTRPNDWQTKLDRQNASTPAWRVNVSASAGSVTIKNTYIGKRPDAWMKNGMSESGTVTWTPPSKSTIRPGDVVSVSLTSLNAPRDHSNFFGIASIKVQLYRLDKDGKRVGNPVAYFKGENGQEVLGYGYPRGNQTKALRSLTVSHKFGAGSTEGDRMSICVNASGVSQSVQTEYVYEWKRP